MSAPLETLVTRLALAVRLRDDLTEDDAFGPLRVASGTTAASRNASGWFLFLRLPAGTAPLTVTAAYYLPEELTATIPAPDPLSPVVERTLLPNRLYPFPAGSTIVSGRITGPGPAPVADAAIQGIGRDTRTDAEGRFVAYFRPLTEDDVVVAPDRRHLVKAADGTTQLELTVTHPSFHPRTVTVADLEEGRERVLGALALTPI